MKKTPMEATLPETKIAPEHRPSQFFPKGKNAIWWLQTFFFFTRISGKMIHFDEQILPIEWVGPTTN